jgi:hypothetical protein
MLSVSGQGGRPASEGRFKKTRAEVCGAPVSAHLRHGPAFSRQVGLPGRDGGGLGHGGRRPSQLSKSYRMPWTRHIHGHPLRQPHIRFRLSFRLPATLSPSPQQSQLPCRKVDSPGAKSTSLRQSRLPCRKVDFPTAKSTPLPQSRLPYGKVDFPDAKSTSLRQSRLPWRKVDFPTAKSTPLSQSQLPYGKVDSPVAKSPSLATETSNRWSRNLRAAMDGSPGCGQHDT